MTDDYVPLTDEQVEEITAYAHAKNAREYLPNAVAHIEALLADREHYKRRAEAAERAVSAVERIVQDHVESGLEEWECSGCFPLRETGEHAIGCTYARAFYAVNGREPRRPE